MCRGLVVGGVEVGLLGGVVAINLGDEVDVRRWWCEGRVLYALDGREMDDEGLEPFLRLPTM